MFGWRIRVYSVDGKNRVNKVLKLFFLMIELLLGKL